MWCFISNCRTVPKMDWSMWSDKVPLIFAVLLEESLKDMKNLSLLGEGLMPWCELHELHC